MSTSRGLMSAAYSLEELLATVLSRLVRGLPHIAVGALSPLPAAAALLARDLGTTPTRVSILGSARHLAFTDGGRELFDCAAQGRIDAFFLSGAQIDGQANINLVGVGDYAAPRRRFPGSFGSAYLYSLIPHVILFRLEHTPRVLVPRVDFVSAAGVSPPHEYRPGGPRYLVTNKCVMRFDRTRARFALESVHPGHTLDEIIADTGFEFDHAPRVATTAVPGSPELARLRGPIRDELRAAYPRFMARNFSGPVTR
jgi:glutaconate CoA-transferase subunit B